MRKNKVLVLNSSIGVLNQIISIVFSFATRSIFIKYIGVELLGLHSTFASILNTLSLADLGFQTAVVYSLYKPIQDKNQNEINDIINILKLIYRCMGCLFFASSVIVAPFIHFFISGIVVDEKVRLYFVLQAMATGFSYFFAYKKTLLYADQKDYVSKTAELFVNIVLKIAQCIVIIFTRSFTLYLILAIAQMSMSNIVVHIYCKREYPYLQKCKLNKNKFRSIWKDVKNIFIGRIAGYIYSSTDNLIISKFVGVTNVGYLGNYTTITYGLKVMTNAMLNPITPVIGGKVAKDNDKNVQKKIFNIYTFICFLVILVLVAPLIVLLDDFVTIWIGSEMLLSKWIVYLLGADFYIHLIHNPSVDFIRASGLFRSEKIIQIAGAVSNLTTSIVFVFVMGMEGVLLGTIVSQMIFWIGRIYVVYRECLKAKKLEYIRYCLRMCVYVAIFSFLIFIQSSLCDMISAENEFFQFILRGITCEGISLGVIVIMLLVNPETKKMKGIIVDTVKRKVGRSDC